MPERLAIVALVAVALTVTVVVVRRWNASRVATLTSAAPLWEALGETPDGRRAVVAFSTPSCAACHTAQAPAIQLAEQQLGASSVRVIRVDASRQPEVARAFGVRHWAVDSDGGLEVALREAVDVGEPSLVEVRLQEGHRSG